VSVDELERTVGQFPHEQGIGVTNFGENAFEDIALPDIVRTPVFRIGKEQICRYTAKGFNAVSDEPGSEKEIGGDRKSEAVYHMPRQKVSGEFLTFVRRMCRLTNTKNVLQKNLECPQIGLVISRL
jgi:hypothetical protein